MKLSVLIVDDEQPARDILRAYASERNDLTIVGEASNGFEALKLIHELHPDLVFLDIQMPKIDGFELLDVLGQPRPQVIFCTAFDHFAVKAFEKNAIDYLMKPFPQDRFNNAVDKVFLQLRQRPNEPTTQLLADATAMRAENGEALSRVVVRLGSRLIVIPSSEIRFIEAQDDYVLIHSDQGDFLKEKTMQWFENNLPKDAFLRIHRSFIVNISRIEKVELYEKDTHLVQLKTGEKMRTSREGYKKLRALL